MSNFAIGEIEKILRYNFKNKKILKMAFTHSSYANQTQTDSNERLEYLGDSILNFVVADYLFNNYKDAEGGLSKMRSKLVNSHFLSQTIEKSGLHKYLLLGPSLLKEELPKSIKENLFEAVVGAIYIDSSLEKAKKFIFRFINIKSSADGADRDFKTILQEEVQKYKGSNLVYITFELPSSPGTFCAEAYVNDVLVSSSKGDSKKKAQNDCAKKALKNTKKLYELLNSK